MASATKLRFRDKSTLQSYGFTAAAAQPNDIQEFEPLDQSPRQNHAAAASSSFENMSNPYLSTFRQGFSLNPAVKLQKKLPQRYTEQQKEMDYARTMNERLFGITSREHRPKQSTEGNHHHQNSNNVAEDSNNTAHIPSSFNKDKIRNLSNMVTQSTFFKNTITSPPQGEGFPATQTNNFKLDKNHGSMGSLTTGRKLTNLPNKHSRPINLHVDFNQTARSTRKNLFPKFRRTQKQQQQSEDFMQKKDIQRTVGDEVIDDEAYKTNYTQGNWRTQVPNCEDSEAIDPFVLECINSGDWLKLLPASEDPETELSLSAMKDIFENDIDYFLHLVGQCACVKCKCGRCKCDSAVHKLKSSKFQSSTYGKDFVLSQARATLYNSGPVMTDQIRTDKRTGLTSVETTTQHQRDFKDYKNFEKHRIVKQEFKPDTFPMAYTSSYKVGSYRWGYLE